VSSPFPVTISTNSPQKCHETQDLFNKPLLDIFKIKVNVMADQSKLCYVVFDELAIKDNVTNNPGHDEVEDCGDIRKFTYSASLC